MELLRLVGIISTLAFISCLPNVGPIAESLSTIPSEKDMFWELEKPQDEYKLPEFPYSFDAMEPYIDKATMEIHYSAIFKEYTVKLNALLKKWKASGDKSAALANTSLINMWRNLLKMPNDIRKQFSYYGGGYMNHLLYFSTMTPNEKGIERTPSAEFIELVERSFHNITEMKRDFNTTSKHLFGTGWVYLVRATGYSDGEYLTVMSTLEEMTPMDNPRIFPILALDVWEHAYFKKYGNRRAEYVQNWWKVVDWVKVERLLNWWKTLVPEVKSVKHIDL